MLPTFSGSGLMVRGPAIPGVDNGETGAGAGFAVSLVVVCAKAKDNVIANKHRENSSFFMTMNWGVDKCLIDLSCLN